LSFKGGRPGEAAKRRWGHNVQKVVGETPRWEPSRLHSIGAAEDTEFTASEMQTELGCISYL